MNDLFSLKNLQNSVENTIEMTIEKPVEKPIKKVRFAKTAPKSSLKQQQAVIPQRFSIRIREKEELKKQKDELKKQKDAIKRITEEIEKEKKAHVLKQKTEFENNMNMLSELFYSKLLIKCN